MSQVTTEQKLLRAAYQLLQKQEDSPYVLNLLGESTVWDGVECDGGCLMEEVKALLDEQSVNADWIGGTKGDDPINQAN